MISSLHCTVEITHHWIDDTSYPPTRICCTWSSVPSNPFTEQRYDKIVFVQISDSRDRRFVFSAFSYAICIRHRSRCVYWNPDTPSSGQDSIAGRRICKIYIDKCIKPAKHTGGSGADDKQRLYLLECVIKLMHKFWTHNGYTRGAQLNIYTELSLN